MLLLKVRKVRFKEVGKVVKVRKVDSFVLTIDKLLI